MVSAEKSACNGTVYSTDQAVIQALLFDLQSRVKAGTTGGQKQVNSKDLRKANPENQTETVL